MLTRKDKEEVIAEVSQIASEAQSVIVAGYHGTNVAQMTELRATAREQGVYLKVVKNTLARRALEKTDFECIREGLNGPLMLAFSRDDVSAAAKVIKKFISDNENTLDVKMVALPNQLLDKKELESLASLPSREEALATMMAMMQAPVAKLVRTLAGVPAKLTGTLVAVKESKG